MGRLFEATRSRWDRVDLLFNNAGTFGPSGSVDEIAVEDWLATVAVNLTGAFLCARHAVADMKAQQPQGGRIINNGSISAYAPRPGSVAYTATKHAITGLTKSISLDGRPFGIACGQIDIGNAGALASSCCPLTPNRSLIATVTPAPGEDPLDLAFQGPRHRVRRS